MHRRFASGAPVASRASTMTTDCWPLSTSVSGFAVSDETGRKVDGPVSAGAVA